MSETTKTVRQTAGAVLAVASGGFSAIRARAAHIPANWLYVFLISILWFFQFAYVSTNFQPTFYFASSDWISLARHVMDPEAWGTELREGNTAQFRGIGYAVYLILVTFGTLNINLIESANYLTILAAALISFGLFARLFQKHIAFVIVAAGMLTFIPYAFAATILSEHLVIVMLMVLSPLSVLSFVRPEFSYRIYCVTMLALLCTVKTLFLPLLLLYGAYVLVEWRNKGFKASFVRYGVLSFFVAVSFLVTANLSSFLVANYNSGAYIFGVMNTLLYGANTDSDSLHEIYEPVYEAGLITDESAKNLLNTVNKRARDAANEVTPDEQAVAQMSAMETKEIIFNRPNLETYWQLKWLLIRNANNEAMANETAKELYFGYITRHPVRFALNTSKSWINFLMAQPRHYKYEFEPENIFREEGGLKLYRTNTKTNERFIKIWNANGIFFDENGARSNKLKADFNVSIRIRHWMQTIYKLNALVLAIWLIMSIAAVVFAGSRLADGGGKWWKWAGAAFFLNSGFVGLALASVLLHPPLGRYVMQLYPMVAGASIASIGSVWVSANCLLAARRAAP